MAICLTHWAALRQLLCALFVVVASLVLLLPAAFGREQSDRQRSFTTPEQAAVALGAAYEAGDRTAVAEILGDEGHRLVSSGDAVIDRHERAWFLSLYREGHELIAESDSRAVLQLGKDGEPYPIPLVKKAGKWRFDPSEGHEDLLSRRISKAELSALNLVVAYVEAQREYYRQDHNGDGVLEYAQKLRSSPGTQDGLWWEGQPGRRAGPIAGLVESALEEGYVPAKEGQLVVYRGYYYKPLKAQGAHASGGARDYVVGGKMTGGFGLVAFPVRYGISGVMTFLVNQDGVIYQKDLGPKTVEVGRRMASFDPDASWTRGRSN
jgi:hypothetical protein